LRAVGYGNGLSVHAIAGTHVVLFGFDVPPGQVTDLMGFAITRTEGRPARDSRSPASCSAGSASRRSCGSRSSSVASAQSFR